VVGAVREGASAMRATVLELAGLEEGDDSRFAIGALHDLTFHWDVNPRVLCIARVIGVLHPDHFTFVAGDGIGRGCRRSRLTGAQQGCDSQSSEKKQGF